MKNTSECYGKMFPPVISLTQNEPVTGKVSAIRLTVQGWRSPGGLLPPTVRLGRIVWNAPASMAVTGCQQAPF